MKKKRNCYVSQRCLQDQKWPIAHLHLHLSAVEGCCVKRTLYFWKCMNMGELPLCWHVFPHQRSRFMFMSQRSISLACSLSKTPRLNIYYGGLSLTSTMSYFGSYTRNHPLKGRVVPNFRCRFHYIVHYITPTLQFVPFHRFS